MTVFESEPAPDLRESLRVLGRIGTLIALSADSLSSLQRLLAYTHSVCKKHGIDETKVVALERDVDELERLAETLLNRVSYIARRRPRPDWLNPIRHAEGALAGDDRVCAADLGRLDLRHEFRRHDLVPRTMGRLGRFSADVVAPAGLFAIAKWRGWF